MDSSKKSKVVPLSVTDWGGQIAADGDAGAEGTGKTIATSADSDNPHVQRILQEIPEDNSLYFQEEMEDETSKLYMLAQDARWWIAHTPVLFAILIPLCISGTGIFFMKEEMVKIMELSPEARSALTFVAGRSLFEFWYILVLVHLKYIRQRNNSERGIIASFLKHKIIALVIDGIFVGVVYHFVKEEKEKDHYIGLTIVWITFGGMVINQFIMSLSETEKVGLYALLLNAWHVILVAVVCLGLSVCMSFYISCALYLTNGGFSPIIRYGITAFLFPLATILARRAITMELTSMFDVDEHQQLKATA